MTLKMNDDISSRQKVIASSRVGNKEPRANEFLSNQEPVSTQIALVMSTEGRSLPSLLKTDDISRLFQSSVLF